MADDERSTSAQLVWAMIDHFECTSVAARCPMLRPSLWQRHRRFCVASHGFMNGHSAKDKIAHIREQIKPCISSIRMIHEALSSMSKLNEQQAKIVHPGIITAARVLFPIVKSKTVIGTLDQLIDAVYTTLYINAIGWLDLYVGTHDEVLRELSRPSATVALNDDLLSLVLGPTIAYVVRSKLSVPTVERSRVLSEIISLAPTGNQIVDPSTIENAITTYAHTEYAEHLTSSEYNVRWVQVLRIATAMRRVCRAWADSSIWNLRLRPFSLDAPHATSVKRDVSALHLLEDEVECSPRKMLPRTEYASIDEQLRRRREQLTHQRDVLRTRLTDNHSLRIFVSKSNRQAAIYAHMNHMNHNSSLSPVMVFGMSSRTGCNTAFDNESQLQRNTPYAQCHLAGDGTKLCTSALTICMRVQLVSGLLGTLFAHPESHAVQHVRCEVNSSGGVTDITEWAYCNHRLVGCHKTNPQCVELHHGGASIFFKLKASNRELSEAIGTTVARVRFLLVRGAYHAPRDARRVVEVTGDWMVVRTETRERLHTVAKKRSSPDAAVEIHPHAIKRLRPRVAR